MVSITISSGDFSDIKKINAGSAQEATSFLPVVNAYGALRQRSANCFDDTNEVREIGSRNNIYNISLYNDDNNINDNLNYSFRNNADYFVLEADINPVNIAKFEGKMNFGFRVVFNAFSNLKTTDIMREDYDIEELHVGIYGEENKYFYQEKEYYFTVADMEGNPFKYTDNHFIYKIFNTQKEKIYSIKSIELFIDNMETDDIYYVEFSNIKAYIASRYSQDLLSTYYFQINSNIHPFYSLTEDELEEENLILEAELITKGRKVDLESQANNSFIYWFREDASIENGNEYYSPYGGVGWKCLNTRLEYDNGRFSYLKNDYKISIPMNELGIKERFKCVINYGGTDRKIIETAYYKIENTLYRNEKGYNPYSLKCYTEDKKIIEDEFNPDDILIIPYPEEYRTNCFINPDPLVLKAHVPFKEEEELLTYDYYWTRSDSNGLFVNVKPTKLDLLLPGTLTINNNEINDYSYYTCTVKKDDKIIYSDCIKINNYVNTVTLQSSNLDIEQMSNKINTNKYDIKTVKENMVDLSGDFHEFKETLDDARGDMNIIRSDNIEINKEFKKFYNVIQNYQSLNLTTTGNTLVFNLGISDNTNDEEYTDVEEIEGEEYYEEV